MLRSVIFAETYGLPAVPNLLGKSEEI